MDKRILISTGMALAFILLWQFVFSPMIFPKAPPPAPITAPASGAPAALGEKPAAPAAAAPAPQDAPEAPAIVLESASYRITLTNKGAGIRDLVLKGAPPKGKGEVVLLAAHANVAPHFALKTDDAGEKIQTLGWELVEKTATSATFRYVLASKVEIRKTFEVPADGGPPVLKIGLVSLAAPAEGQKEPSVKLQLLAINGLEHDTDYRYEQYSTGFARSDDKGLEMFPLLNVETGEDKIAAAATKEDWEKAAEYLRPLGIQKAWFGAKNRFFALGLLPDGVTRTRIASLWFRRVPPALRPAYGDKKALEVSAAFDAVNVGSTPVAWSVQILGMPLKNDALAALPKGGDLINYGGGCASGCGPFGFLFAPIAQIVNWVAPLILGVLGIVASVLGNYGVAIMVTTLLIRLVLFPLSKRSQVSMYKMQQLGPKIQALRERYKDDQQKFGMEQMRLFRENKINPLSGCLPMVLQMPIFIAMYSVFEMSVDLRGARFLWMDLSQPDHLIGPWTPLVIPLIGLSLDAFNLLPIIMTITWFLQSWYAPRSPDPQMAAQQKMMLAMPVVFGLMCYNLASGLSLYFFVNSLLSMTEQKLIKKFFLQPAPGDGTKV